MLRLDRSATVSFLLSLPTQPPHQKVTPNLKLFYINSHHTPTYNSIITTCSNPPSSSPSSSSYPPPSATPPVWPANCPPLPSPAPPAPPPTPISTSSNAFTRPTLQSTYLYSRLLLWLWWPCISSCWLWDWECTAECFRCCRWWCWSIGDRIDLEEGLWGGSTWV